MYRSSMKMAIEEMPIIEQPSIDEFIHNGHHMANGVPPPNFVERVSSLPLVRNFVDRFLVAYEKTKDRNGLLRSALETGESTVQATVKGAVTVMNKTGITGRLQKPLGFADQSACYMLDKVEEKLPIITKSPYEIKLMVIQKVEGKIDQIQTAKENTVERVRDTIDSVKEMGSAKVQAVMDTPYGQTVNNYIEYGLQTADSAIDKFLPEEHLKNGNATNGNYMANGYHARGGNLEHAKHLSHKLKRRISIKSHNVVDAVIQTPAVTTVHDTIAYVRRRASGKVVIERVERTRKFTRGIAAKVYVATVVGVARVANVFQRTLMIVLPSFMHERVNLLLDKGVSYIPKIVPIPVVAEDRIAAMETRSFQSPAWTDSKGKRKELKYKPPGSSYVTFVRGWVAFVGMMALANTLQAFISPEFVWTRLYNAPRAGATELAARTYGLWTLLAGVIRFLYAYNMYSWELFLAALTTFVVALAHFASELLYYRSGLADVGMFSPIIVSAISIPIMLAAIPYIWPSAVGLAAGADEDDTAASSAIDIRNLVKAKKAAKRQD
ncbi:uncharacterized protein LOC129584088 [Paramacrobiotus metropolitanus]|uniref:uncharacterized protein LOC129584088 n=1 Tax=Paramacrobiotus metropolitanus TaxID=2943436 RepID=UPI00244583CA|nr:uncharacterized protein LOC129584088 [Paramacrobiotus metropolitanus]